MPVVCIPASLYDMDDTLAHLIERTAAAVLVLI